MSAGIPKETLGRELNLPEVPLLNSPEKKAFERKLYRDNATIRPDRMIFLAQTAEIHRKFLREIMGESTQGRPGVKSDIVVFTGSTYDIAAEPLSIAASLEGYDKNELPEIATWNSMLYFERHTAGPNSIVYKYISESTIEFAIESVRYALFLSQDKSEQELEISERLHGSREDLISYLDTSLSELLYHRDPKLKYVVSELLKTSDVTPKDLTSDNAKAYFYKIREEAASGSSLTSSFAAELHQLEEHLLDLKNRTKSGAYPLRQNDTQEGYALPPGIDRANLMKALYPEFLTALFHEDGTPKEIAFYDNVSVSGEKMNAYLGFMESLGIADKVRVFLMYTKPDATRDFADSNAKVIVWKEIDSDFVRYSSDKPEDVRFMGKTHDRETALDSAPKSYADDKYPEKKAANQKKKLLSFREQLQLPDAMATLDKRTQELEVFADQPFNPQYIDTILGYLDQPPLPHVFTSSYLDYDSNEYEDFEKSFDYTGPSEEKKKLFKALRAIVDQIKERIIEKGEPLVRVILFDNELEIALRAILRLPDFKDIADKVTFKYIYDFSSTSSKASPLLDPVYTIGMGKSFPRAQHLRDSLSEFAKKGGKFAELSIVNDSRKKFSDESRREKLLSFGKTLSEDTNRMGPSLQELQAFTDQDIIQTIRIRYLKMNRTMPGYGIDSKTELLSGGAHVFAEKLQKLYEKNKDIESGQSLESIFDTQEYLDVEKDILNLTKWYSKIYEECVSELESISQKNIDMNSAPKIINQLKNIQKKFGQMKELHNIFDGLHVIKTYDERYAANKEGSGPATVFDTADSIYFSQYDGVTKQITILEGLIADEYEEKYFTGEDIDVTIQSPEPFESYWSFPAIYKNERTSREAGIQKTVQVRRAVEILRYLTKVIAANPE